MQCLGHKRGPLAPWKGCPGERHLCLLMVSSAGRFRALWSALKSRGAFGWLKSGASSIFGWFFSSARLGLGSLGAALAFSSELPRDLVGASHVTAALRRLAKGLQGRKGSAAAVAARASQRCQRCVCVKCCDMRIVVVIHVCVVQFQREGTQRRWEPRQCFCSSVKTSPAAAAETKGWSPVRVRRDVSRAVHKARRLIRECVEGTYCLLSPVSALRP